MVRLLTATGFAAAAATVAVSAAAASVTGQVASPQTQQMSITIRSGDHVVAPNVALAPGVPVRLTVVNYTHEFHTFTIAGLRVSALILPAIGQTPRRTLVAFTPRGNGAFTWRCVICPSGAHGHAHAMRGEVYLIIDPAALP